MYMRINSKQVLALGSGMLILFAIASGIASGQSQPQSRIATSNQLPGNTRAVTPTNQAGNNPYLLYTIRRGPNDPIYHLYAVSVDAPLSPIAIPGNPLLNQFINSQSQFFAQFAWSSKTDTFLIPGENGIYVLPEGATVPTPFKTSTPSITITNAQWSPDGQSVVFILLDDSAAPDARTYYLAVYTADGILHKIAGPYTSKPMMGMGEVTANPTWSPDGQYIAFQHSTFGVGDTGEHISTTILQVITTACLANLAAICQISSLSPQNTPGFTPLPPPSPAALGTGPVDTSEEWVSPSWFPDSNRLLFVCGTVSAQVFGLCTIGRNGSNFTRLFNIPSWSGFGADMEGAYALSPDGQFIAHIDDSGIELFEVSSSRDIAVVRLGQDEDVGEMVWVSQQSVQSLLQLPTLEPSPTASLKLSLKTICVTLPKNVWTWAIINPNPETVYYHIEMYDSQTNTIEISRNGQIAAASNNTPATDIASIETNATTLRVRIFVNGVLQDDEPTPPLPCRRTS